ncbi:TPA: hypothetical protein U0910_002098 [Streptococcus suis 8830]|uniref:hypothetical protein n=1 Tax=Streptococcus suis TaxID=1307 RepID=UPI0004628453|nr:hypothetical protein [Streptococcus suis]HEM3204025.1 hypothetical protein [Streptococcus suis 8830]
MRIIKDLKEDYKNSKVYEMEGFIEWFLKRKLGFWGKIFFAIALYLLGVLITSNPVNYIYMMYATVFLSIIVGTIELGVIIRERKNKKE